MDSSRRHRPSPTKPGASTALGSLLPSSKPGVTPFIQLPQLICGCHFVHISVFWVHSSEVCVFHVTVSSLCMAWRTKGITPDRLDLQGMVGTQVRATLVTLLRVRTTLFPPNQLLPMKDTTVACVTKTWALTSALGVTTANLGCMLMQCVLVCQMASSSPFWTMEEMVSDLCALGVM